VKGVMFVGVMLYCDEFGPSVDPQFPQWGQVLEDFVRVLYGFALLADHSVVFF
jgi:hypothetical protein